MRLALGPADGNGEHAFYDLLLESLRRISTEMGYIRIDEPGNYNTRTLTTKKASDIKSEAFFVYLGKTEFLPT